MKNNIKKQVSYFLIFALMFNILIGFYPQNGSFAEESINNEQTQMQDSNSDQENKEDTSIQDVPQDTTQDVSNETSQHIEESVPENPTEESKETPIQNIIEDDVNNENSEEQIEINSLQEAVEPEIEWSEEAWDYINQTLKKGNEEVKAMAMLDEGDIYILGTKSGTRGNIYILDKTASSIEDIITNKIECTKEIKWIEVDESSNKIYVFEIGGLLRISEDKGETWNSSINIGKGSIESAAIAEENELFISTSTNNIQYNANNGEGSWIAKNNGIPEGAKTKNIYYDKQNLYVGLELADKSKSIYFSKDNGENWNRLDDDSLETSYSRELMGVFNIDGELYIGTRDGVWKKEDSDWVKIPGKIGEEQDVVLMFEKEDSIYAITKRGNHIYEATKDDMYFQSTLKELTITDAWWIERDGDFVIIGAKNGLFKEELERIRRDSDVEVENSVYGEIEALKYGLSESYNLDLGFTLLSNILNLLDESYIPSKPEEPKPETPKPEVPSSGSGSKGSSSSSKNQVDITTSKEIKVDFIKENINKDSNVVKYKMNEDEKSAQVKFNKDVLTELNKSNKGLEISFKEGIYIIPKNIDVIEKMSKENGELKEVTFLVQKLDSNNINKDNLISPILEFKLEGVFSNKKVELNYFGKQYIERKIELNKEVDTKKAVGVVLENGVWKPVPTTFIKENGKTFAVIKRNSNSIYSVMEYSKTFEDIKNHWAKENIELLASKKIVNGIKENEFNPNGNITRAQFVTMLVRSLGLKNIDGLKELKDVEKGSWYEKEVYTAMAFGIVTGYNDDTFKPNKEVTREEMAVMIMRTIQIINGIDNHANNISFKDEHEISSWSKDAISIGVKEGIMKGYEDNSFKPKNKATRGEGASLFKNMMEKLEFISK